MSESNNPVMQQPQRPPISRTAAKGIIAAIGTAIRGAEYQPNRSRKGKHGGRNAGAFGKQGR